MLTYLRRAKSTVCKNQSNHTKKSSSDDAQILLDENELAKGCDVMTVARVIISPTGSLVAYAVMIANVGLLFPFRLIILSMNQRQTDIYLQSEAYICLYMLYFPFSHQLLQKVDTIGSETYTLYVKEIETEQIVSTVENVTGLFFFSSCGNRIIYVAGCTDDLVIGSRVLVHSIGSQVQKDNQEQSYT